MIITSNCILVLWKKTNLICCPCNVLYLTEARREFWGLGENERIRFVILHTHHLQIYISLVVNYCDISTFTTQGATALLLHTCQFLINLKGYFRGLSQNIQMQNLTHMFHNFILCYFDKSFFSFFVSWVLQSSYNWIFHAPIFRSVTVISKDQSVKDLLLILRTFN